MGNINILQIKNGGIIAQQLRDVQEVTNRMFDTVQETFTATADQTNFTLSKVPNNRVTTLTVNGLAYYEDIDYTVDRENQTVTWINESYSLQAGDIVFIEYCIRSSNLNGYGTDFRVLTGTENVLRISIDGVEYNLATTETTANSALTADKLSQPVSIKTTDGTHESVAVSFDGSSDTSVLLPTTITASLDGQATSAINDENNNSIVNTYATKQTAVSSIISSGTTVTYLNANNEILGTFETPDTHYTVSVSTGENQSLTNSAETINPYINLIENDTVSSSLQLTGQGDATVSSMNGKIVIAVNDSQVQQSVTTETGVYPILLVKNSGQVSDTKDGAAFVPSININPATNTITATNFNGTALQATKAINDANGNPITTTYAPLTSPNLLGVPTAPTAPDNSSDTTIANTAFVQNTADKLMDEINALKEEIAYLKQYAVLANVPTGE